MSDDGEDPDGLTSLTTISEGASLFVVGKVFSRGIDFLTSIILTRFLGANLYGIYAYLSVIFSLFTTVSRVGNNNSVMRFLPEYRDQPRKRRVVLTLSYGTSIAVSAVIAAGVYVFAPAISSLTLDDPLFVDVLRITAIVIPANTLALVTYSVFRAVERMDYNVLTSSIVQPLFRLTFVGGAVALGHSLIGAAAGLVVAAVLTAVAALTILIRRTELDLIGQPTRTDAREYYGFSIPLVFNQLGYFLYKKIDILMLGFLLAGAEVGIYRISVAVAGFLSLPLVAFDQLFPPIASKLYHDDQREELESVYRTVTKLVFTAALFPGIAATLYAPEVLSVFGAEFTRGAPVLILFVFAQLTNCLVGPSGSLLMMSDHQYVALFNQTSSGIVNAILNFVLIQAIGFVGAAIATASVLVVVNLLRVGQVWYLEGLSPYDRSYLEPVVAGLVSGTVMFSLTFALGGFTLVFTGGFVGVVTFAAVLYLFGVEEELELLQRVIQ